MTDLDAIRERHRLHAATDTCNVDGDGWPCDTAQALARVDELEAALKRYDEAADIALGIMSRDDVTLGRFSFDDLTALEPLRHARLARPESKP